MNHGVAKGWSDKLEDICDHILPSSAIFFAVIHPSIHPSVPWWHSSTLRRRSSMHCKCKSFLLIGSARSTYFNFLRTGWLPSVDEAGRPIVVNDSCADSRSPFVLVRFTYIAVGLCRFFIAYYSFHPVSCAWLNSQLLPCIILISNFLTGDIVFVSD